MLLKTNKNKIPLSNFSNLNSNCSNLLDMRNFQEQVEKAFYYQKQIPNFFVWFFPAFAICSFFWTATKKNLGFLLTMKQWKQPRFHNWLDLFESTVQTKFLQHKWKPFSNSHLIKLLICLFTYKLLIRLFYFQIT